MTLAEKIRNVREEKSMTQKQVAALMGISQQAYGQYESGSREPKPETLGRIAAALGSNLSELTNGVDTISNPFSDPYYDSFIKGNYEQFENQRLAFRQVLHCNPEAEAVWNAFQKLNGDGQKVAVERLEELTQIPKYQYIQPESLPWDDFASTPDKDPAEK